MLGRQRQVRGLQGQGFDEPFEAPLQILDGGLHGQRDPLASGCGVGPEALMLENPAAGGNHRDGEQTGDAQSRERTGDE